MASCHVCHQPLEVGQHNRCLRCGAPQGVEKHEGNSFLMRMVAPVNVSGWAIAGGYLALFSIFLFFYCQHPLHYCAA